MKNILLVVSLLFTTIDISIAGTTNSPEIDSLIRIKDTISDTCEKASKYMEIAQRAFISDPQGSLDFIDKGLTLAENSSCEESTANLYVNKSIILNHLGRREASIEVINKAISIYESTGEHPLNLGKAFLSKGNTHLNQDQISAALDCYLQSLSAVSALDEEGQVKKFKSSLYGNMGGVYSKMKQFDSALYYINKSVELDPIENEPIRFIDHHFNLSTIYKVQDSFDLALHHLNKSDSLNQTIKSPLHQIKINLNRAYIYSYLAKHEDALDLIQTTQPLIGNSPNYKDAYNMFMITSSKVYYKANKYQKCINISLEFLESIDIEKSAGRSVNVMLDLYLSYKALGDYKKSLKYHEEYKRLLDIVTGENTQNEINRLKQQFESEKKKKEIILLKEKDKISQLEIKRKDDELKIRTYFISVLTLIILLLVIISLFIYRQIKLKQQKKAIELEHKALRSQMNPHFIFNSLNSIQRMYVEGSTDEANEFLSEFSGLIRSILENSNHSKIALNEEINTLRAYLELEKLRTKDKFDFTIHVDDSIDSYNYQVPPLVLQPFVENAIWHGVLPGSKKGDIAINLSKDGDRIHVEVIDNGIGFSSESNREHESQGIKITEKRIGSKVNIQSSSEGTKIDFTI
ncbi:MAG: histidine kinase [Brumimicrobium sp.]